MWMARKRCCEVIFAVELMSEPLQGAQWTLIEAITGDNNKEPNVQSKPNNEGLRKAQCS